MLCDNMDLVSLTLKNFLSIGEQSKTIQFDTDAKTIDVGTF